MKLVEFIKEKILEGTSVTNIKALLLENDWPESTIDAAFASMGVDTQNNHSNSHTAVTKQDSFARESITMDKIIEKIIPIVGALY